MPRCLLDSNVLMRLTHAPDPLHAPLWSAIGTMEANGDEFVYLSQNAIEAWNVFTRPLDKNGFGFTPTYSLQGLNLIGQSFTRLPDTDDVYPRWLSLVTRYSVLGKKVHDTRLVAAVLAAGVTRIATLNPGDFVRFAAEGITVIDLTPTIGTRT